MKDGLEIIKRERDRWYREKIEKKGIRVPSRFNPAGIPIELLYTPLDTEKDNGYLKNIGFPGEYPYTRGIPIDAFAPRFSFSLGTTLIDFFENVVDPLGGS